jgi:hypothetical protein
MSTDTKKISYRGGIVQFNLPSHWREEYEPDGGGTFYEDRPDSGTLRLNVITAESKSAEPSEQGIARSFPADSCELLPSGIRLRRRKVASEERGTAIVLYRWEFGVAIPPSRVRIVCFTHTILAKQESDPATKAELSFLEESIRRAEFSREGGI